MKELGILDDILFVHPKDVQDGKVELTANDVTTNLPYRPEVALSFDHHSSEDARVTEDADNRVAISSADSAARVVYEYFGGAERFPRVSAEMMEAVDKADAAKFNESEILDPQGWILLSFLMDPRTGLGRFRDFRISNYELMMLLIDLCLERSVEEILESPRRRRARGSLPRARGRRDRADPALLHGARPRGGARPPRGGAHPSDQPLHGLRAAPPVHRVGARPVGPAPAEHRARRRPLHHRPLIDFDIGRLMLAHGGGGHEAAGTCQIENDRAQAVLAEIVGTINRRAPQVVRLLGRLTGTGGRRRPGSPAGSARSPPRR